MALDPGAMHTRIIENLPEKTGHALDHWLKVLDSVEIDKAACMALLKNHHSLGHHTAVAVIREKTGDVPWAAPRDLEDSLRSQIDLDVVALYDTLRDHVHSIDGVEVVPCKTYTGFKTKRQFAVIKPSKAHGFDVGSALPVSAHPDLSDAKGLGSDRILSKTSAEIGETALKDLLAQAARTC